MAAVVRSRGSRWSVCERCRVCSWLPGRLSGRRKALVKLFSEFGLWALVSSVLPWRWRWSPNSNLEFGLSLLHFIRGAHGEVQTRLKWFWAQDKVSHRCPQHIFVFQKVTYLRESLTSELWITGACPGSTASETTTSFRPAPPLSALPHSNHRPSLVPGHHSTEWEPKWRPSP